MGLLPPSVRHVTGLCLLHRYCLLLTLCEDAPRTSRPHPQWSTHWHYLLLDSDALPRHCPHACVCVPFLCLSLLLIFRDKLLLAFASYCLLRSHCPSTPPQFPALCMLPCPRLPPFMSLIPSSRHLSSIEFWTRLTALTTTMCGNMTLTRGARRCGEETHKNTKTCFFSFFFSKFLGLSWGLVLNLNN